jgi:Kef-type K+ transport system membrane component KefB
VTEAFARYPVSFPNLQLLLLQIGVVLATAHLFPADGLGALNALSQIGLILLLFLVGMEVRPQHSSGFAGHAIAASMLTPLVLGAALAAQLHPALSPDVSLSTFAVFMGAAMSITAFPVLARILTERGMLDSRAGTIAISCAVVDDVAAWCLVALLMAASASAWLVVLAALAAYGLTMRYIVRPLIRKRVRILRRLCLLLASSWAIETLGVHALFGAFVAGLLMPRDLQLSKLVEPLTSTLLLPLFFAFTGLRTSVQLISGSRMWLYCAAMIVVAISGKFFGCAFLLRARGLPWRESLTVGTLVNTRGLIDLVILDIGLDRKIISPAARKTTGAGDDGLSVRGVPFRREDHVPAGC